MLSVTNPGPVVPAATLDRLLQPFQRLGTDRLTWAFTWQVLDSNQGRRMSTVLQISTAATTALRMSWRNVTPPTHSGALVPRISRARDRDLFCVRVSSQSLG